MESLELGGGLSGSVSAFSAESSHGPVSLWSSLTVSCVAGPSTCESWGAWAEPESPEAAFMAPLPGPLRCYRQGSVSHQLPAWSFWVGRESNFKPQCWMRQGFDYRSLGAFLLLHSSQCLRYKTEFLVGFVPADWFFLSSHLHWALGLHGFWLYREVRSSSPPRLARSLVLINPAHWGIPGLGVGWITG